MLARVFDKAGTELRDAGATDVAVRIDVDVGAGTDSFQSTESFREEAELKKFDRVHGWVTSDTARVDVTLTREPKITDQTFSVAVLLEIVRRDEAGPDGLVELRDSILRAIERGRPDGVREPLKGLSPPDQGPEPAVRADIASARTQVTFPLARALLASAALFVAFLAFPWVREIVPGLAQSDALFWGDPSLGEIAYMGVAALVFGSLLALQARLVAEFQPEGVEVTGGPQSGFLNFVFGALKTFALPVVLTIAGAYALNKLGLATN